jgi:uncharacterized membrane protein
MGAALLAAALIRMVDEGTQWTLMGFGSEGARAVAGALASSLLTFIVFAFSIILLQVQLAGGQLSPRIIVWIFESHLAKMTLSAFVFSYTYTLAALGRVEDRVPQLPVMVAVLASLSSVALFLFLFQKVSQSIRPVMILARIAADTRTAINALYPNPFGVHTAKHPEPNLANLPGVRTIFHRGRSGVVLAFDALGLMERAGRAGITIELVPQVGDFLATGEEVFRLYGAGADTVAEADLGRSVLLGPERNLEYDPAFGFRVIVDIAEKALSPGINDPTTGVLAIDQIEHLLRLLGGRQLDTGILRDTTGEARLVYRTPGWEEFVDLAVTEIRLYGANSPQVTRRLMAMFEHLVQVLPPQRSEVLCKELALLQRTIDGRFADPEDRRRAAVGDRQGFGSGRMSVMSRKGHDRPPAPAMLAKIDGEPEVTR